MTNLYLDNISLIILLPLWIFLIIMGGRFFSVYVNKPIIYILTLLSSFLGIGVCGCALLNIKEPAQLVYPFIRINEFAINIGLQIDKLSLLTAFVLFVVSFAVQVFSVSFMKDEKKSYKFFAFLNLFNFSMAFLLFSPNLFQFYVFWEIVGIVSYLLIGFDYKNEIKSKASQRVFLINRIGDTALLSGIILTSYYMQSYANDMSYVTLGFEDLDKISTFIMAYTSEPVFCIICGLFIIAAFVKSAQFPFYTWLQDAMEAKAPVSALLHSATMVAAGIYLTIRLMPMLTLNPLLTNIILWFGMLTAVICSVLASIETQPKKILAYSTSANLGLVFTAIGVLNIKAALILMFAHAFIKSMLFLLLPKDNKMPKINFAIFVIGALSLAGVLLSGTGGKEILFDIVKYSSSLSYILMFVCFAAGFYIIRLAALIHNASEFNEKPNVIEFVSFLILLFANVTLYIAIYGNYKLEEPFVAAIGGIALALLINKHKALEKFNQTPKLLENLYYNHMPKFYEKFTSGLNYIDNKILGNYKPIIFISGFCVKSVHRIEQNIMNKTVSLIGSASKEMSKRDMMLQSGNVQTYNAYAFIFVTIIIVLILSYIYIQ